MKLEISPNKLCQENQEIEFSQHVLTFIGENGCGKSSILESIFQRNLQNSSDQTVVCFSSGQNESYSKLYFPFIKDARNFVIIRDEEQSLLALDKINTFYFDYDWSKFLIFFASTLKKGGHVQDILKEKYVDINDHNEDLTSVLNFSIEVGQAYIKRINQSLKKEEVEASLPTLRKTDFHNQLSKIIELKIDPDYEFTKPLKKKKIDLTYNDVVNFYKKDSSSILKFLSIASNENYFINVKESDLSFKNGISLKDLSDGEYQLLVVYSIIDLFDSENTLFLFDEIDSHLYFRNIEKLWDILQKNILGKVITTTHNADSFIQNKNHEGIKLVIKGQLSEEYSLNSTVERIKELTSSKEYEYKISSTATNIVLIDDVNDWRAFKTLASIKCDNFDESIFSKIKVLKVSSGPNDFRNQIFGDSKLKWVDKFISINEIAAINTKRIFMICDKDEFPIQFCINGVQVTGRDNQKQFGNRGIAYLLSWKRRQIENYYMSYTLAQRCNILNELNNTVLPQEHLREGNSMDNNSVRVAEVKDIFKVLYSDASGLDLEQRNEILHSIPKDEISEDIEKMYNFIVSKIN